MINSINSSPTFKGMAVLRDGKKILAAVPVPSSGSIEANVQSFADKLGSRERFASRIGGAKVEDANNFWEYLSRVVFSGKKIKKVEGDQFITNMAGLRASTKESIGTSDYLIFGSLEAKKPGDIQFEYRY